MAIKTYKLKSNQEPSEEQIRRMEAGSKETEDNPVYDPENPPLTETELAKMAEIIQERRQTKKILSLRVKPSTIATAKKLGKGYTGLLSRLLDEAIKDPELVKKCL
jgi:hypothetical protein